MEDKLELQDLDEIDTILKEMEQEETNNKPFRCTDCSKTFARAQEKKVHERIHSGEKPYSCSLCDKKFSTSQN